MTRHVLALIALAAGVARAQDSTRAPDPAPRDSAEIVFAHAAAATPADAAADYRRIVVEYPESPRAEEALLRLAQLELVQGDREEAATHLARFTRDHTTHGPAAAPLEFGAGEAYLQLDDLTHACPMLAAARGDAAPTDVELINRITYVQVRCRAAAIGPPAAADTAHAAAPAHPAAAPAHPAAAPSPPSSPRAKPAAEHGGYAVQVGAFSTRAEADAAVRNLAAKGMTARVVGTKAPYRVWIGRYHTRTQAESERKTLAAQGTTGFVTEAEP